LNTNIVLDLFIILYLLLLSAFFSSAEVAYFLINDEIIESIKHKFYYSIVEKLLKEPKQLLVTVLLGNSLAAVGLAIVSYNLFYKLLSPYYSTNIIAIIQVISITIIVIIFGEITPKLVATKFPLFLVKLYCLPLYFVFLLFYPVTKLLSDLMRILTKKINYIKVKKNISNYELDEIADIGKEHGALDDNEKNLLQGFFSFMEIPAKKIMTPRVDMVAIEENTPFEEIKKIVLETKHSRIPVYKDNIDNIVGVLYAKELLKYLNEEEFTIKEILKPAYFVPEFKSVSDLLYEFQEKKIHIGIVVDEYGGTLGIITLTDIITEIVGDIADEDGNEENKFEKINENTYIISGDTTVDEFEEIFNIRLEWEDNDFETVAGFILYYNGDIPQINQVFEYKDFNFKILEIKRNRITKVLVEDKRNKESEEIND